MPAASKPPQNRDRYHAQRCVAEEQRHAGGREPQEADHQAEVGDPMVAVEALDVPPRQARGPSCLSRSAAPGPRRLPCHGRRVAPAPPSATARTRARCGCRRTRTRPSSRICMNRDGVVERWRSACAVVRVGVRIVGGEVRVGAFVALLAGRDAALRRHRRARVARRQHLVRAVAVGARGHAREAELGHLAVERVAVGVELSAWQWPHSRMTSTFQLPSSARRMPCAVWQSAHTGARGSPFWTSVAVDARRRTGA